MAFAASPVQISSNDCLARLPSGGRVHDMHGRTSPLAWMAIVSHGRRDME